MQKLFILTPHKEVLFLPQKKRFCMTQKRKRTQSEKESATFDLSVEYSDKSGMLVNVEKQLSKIEFLSLCIGRESVKYEADFGSGKISWQELYDAVALVQGNIDPIEYFNIEADEDGNLWQG